MSRTYVERVRCDLCGHGGPYTVPGDFVQVTGDGVAYDLCHWCARAPRLDVGARLECGPHVVIFVADPRRARREGRAGSWRCACGVDEAGERARRRVDLMPAGLLAAVPCLSYALASAHAQA